MGSYGHMPGITPDGDRPWRLTGLAASSTALGDAARLERELAEAGEVILTLGARAHQAEQERDEARDLWARDIAQAETTIYLLERERDEAVSALRWYADPASYQDGCPGDLAGSHQTRRWQPDGGEVARRALSRLTPDASSRKEVDT